ILSVTQTGTILERRNDGLVPIGRSLHQGADAPRSPGKCFSRRVKLRVPACSSRRGFFMLRLVLLLSLASITMRAALAEETEPAAQSPGGAAADPKALEYFESKVRPLLAERCLECHGPEKQKGNLRLDSLAAILKGGDSGPALVAGKPEESLLVQAIGYTS